MTTTVTPFIWFQDQAHDAARFYGSATWSAPASAGAAAMADADRAAGARVRAGVNKGWRLAAACAPLTGATVVYRSSSSMSAPTAPMRAERFPPSAPSRPRRTESAGR